MIDFEAYRQHKRLKVARANLRAGLEPDLIMDEDGWPVDDWQGEVISEEELANAMRVMGDTFSWMNRPDGAA